MLLNKSDKKKLEDLDKKQKIIKKKYVKNSVLIKKYELQK